MDNPKKRKFRLSCMYLRTPLQRTAVILSYELVYTITDMRFQQSWDAITSLKDPLPASKFLH